MEPHLRQASADDYEFAYAAKREALGPHVAQRWGWDDAYQRSLHHQRWTAKPWQIIGLDAMDVGTVSIDVLPSHLHFGEFYVLRPYRGRGVGAAVLEGALQLAALRGLETRLECLRWNPAAMLYLRHGFHVVGESETHYLLSRPPR